MILWGVCELGCEMVGVEEVEGGYGGLEEKR